MYRFDRVSEVAHKQVKIDELMCRFDEISKITHKQIKINELYMNFNKLMMSKLRKFEN